MANISSLFNQPQIVFDPASSNISTTWVVPTNYNYALYNSANVISLDNYGISDSPRTNKYIDVAPYFKNFQDISTLNANTIGIYNDLFIIASQIFKIIQRTIEDFKIGQEWTKDRRYKIWFDKWFDFLDLLITNNTFSPLHNTSSYLFKRGTFEKFKKYEVFEESNFSSKEHIYIIQKPTNIGFEQFYAFFPELISTFANTFLYRVITLTVSNGKERKITIINQKLPPHIVDLYNAINKSHVLNKFYNRLTTSLERNRRINYRKHVIGFIEDKSYLDHVNPHIGCGSLLTCDINKFYNCLNLKHIVDNNIFGSIFDLITKESLNTPSLESNLFSVEIDRYIHFCKSTCTDMFNALMFFFTCNGMLATGSFASPIISNILMIPFDVELDKYSNEKYFKVTRYVDDICISSIKERKRDESYMITIDTARDIEKMLNKYGLYLKYEKTHIYGQKENKVIANLNLPTKKGEYPSIGSKLKLELKTSLNGKDYKDLTSEELGKINWVRSVNPKQYEFIKSGILNFPVPKTKPLVKSKDENPF